MNPTASVTGNYLKNLNKKEQKLKNHNTKTSTKNENKLREAIPPHLRSKELLPKYKKPIEKNWYSA